MKAGYTGEAVCHFQRLHFPVKDIEMDVLVGGLES